MNYENKYKETLEKIENLIDKDHNDINVDDVLNIFPELKESEDERIRKWLIGYFNQYIIDGMPQVFGNGLNIKDVIAWLEKQESVGEIVERCKSSWYNEGKIQGQIEGLSDEEKYQQGWHDALEKQGEQKQADKVEPKFKVKYAGSEYNVYETKDIAGVTFYGIEDEPNHIDYVQAGNCERVDGYSIKETGSPFPTKPAKFSEQNPAWSEEDEENMGKILDAIGSYYYLTTDDDILCDWLKSIKQRIGGE